MHLNKSPAKLHMEKVTLRIYLFSVFFYSFHLLLFSFFILSAFMFASDKFFHVLHFICSLSLYFVLILH